MSVTLEDFSHPPDFYKALSSFCLHMLNSPLTHSVSRSLSDYSDNEALKDLLSLHLITNWPHDGEIRVLWGLRRHVADQVPPGIHENNNEQHNKYCEQVKLHREENVMFFFNKSVTMIHNSSQSLTLTDTTTWICIEPAPRAKAAYLWADTKPTRKK